MTLAAASLTVIGLTEPTAAAAAGCQVADETFGAGLGFGPPLAPGTTTYTYVAGVVHDGMYTVTNQVDNAWPGGEWSPGGDHTGDTNGRMMIVNAAAQPGRFYTRTVSGLTVGKTYAFGAWLANLNSSAPALPNVTFKLLDPTTGRLLGDATTGNLPNTPTLTWKSYGVQFIATQPSVTIAAVNNAPGGNGNDIALDDITVSRVCGASTFPGLSLVKKAHLVRDANHDGRAETGDQIGYTFTTTNLGPTQLSAVAVHDPNVTATPATLTLAPHASGTFSSSSPHTVTKSDLKRGFVSNTAYATADSGDGTVVSFRSTARVPVTAPTPPHHSHHTHHFVAPDTGANDGGPTGGGDTAIGLTGWGVLVLVGASGGLLWRRRHSGS